MQAIEYIKNLPQTILSAWQKIPPIGKSIQDQFQKLSELSLWKQHGKPLYERHIKPLDTTCFLLLTASIALAVLVMAAAVKIIGQAGAPAGAVLDCFLIMGSLTYCRQHIKKHFDRLAWDELDLIRKVVKDVDFLNPDFSAINQSRAKLLEPQFQHLEADIKSLDEKIRQFKENVIKSPHAADAPQIKKALMENVSDLQQKIDKNKTIT